MSRESNRAMGESSTAAAGRFSSRKRVGVFQFLREVRGELTRVNWPSRKDVTSYTLVVLVAVTLLTRFVFGLDQLFGALVLWIFG